MPRNTIRQNRLISDRLHPIVYAVILGLGLWLILSVWGFFGIGGHTGLELMVVSIFIIIALVLPVLLWRISRSQHRSPPDRTPFTDWASGEFETFSGRLKGSDAIIMLLMPIIAVSLGMTVFAIVLHVVAKVAA